MHNWDPVLIGESEEYFLFALERVAQQLAYEAKYEHLECVLESATVKIFLVREKDAGTNQLWLATHDTIGRFNKRFNKRVAARTQQLISLNSQFVKR